MSIRRRATYSPEVMGYDREPGDGAVCTDDRSICITGLAQVECSSPNGPGTDQGIATATGKSEDQDEYPVCSAQARGSHRVEAPPVRTLGKTTCELSLEKGRKP